MERVSDGTGVFTLESLQQEMLKNSGGVVSVEPAVSGVDSSELIRLPVDSLPDFADQAGEAMLELGELAGTMQVSVWLNNDGDKKRFEELLIEHVPDPLIRNAIQRVQGYLHRGFIWDGQEAWIPYHELIHRYNHSTPRMI